MPSPIELDPKRWVHVAPNEDDQITVKCLNFACYYANQPKEVASEGTELAANASLTIETPSGQWFRAKEPASTEQPKMSILEVKLPEVGGNIQVDTANLAEGAVTETKLGSEAVTTAKLKGEAVTFTKVHSSPSPTAGASESLTAVVGEKGVPRMVIAVYTAKAEASAKVKIKHGLAAEFFTVTAWKASGGVATEQALGATAGAISSVKYVNANEIEVTLAVGVPAAKEEIFFAIVG